MNNDRLKVSPDEYDSTWIQTYGWDTPDEFIRTQGKNLRPRIRYTLKIADIESAMHVLDVGCGRGEIVLHCARKGVHAVGVDYSKEAISIAEKARSAHTTDEQNRMKFICDDVANIKPTKQFDRIFILDVVEHLYDWELSKLLKNCYNILDEKSGFLVIHTLPNKWLYEITYRRILRFFMPWLPANPRTDKQMAIHVNEMTIPHLSRLLSESGFRSQIWLKELLVDQANWHKKQPHKDLRGKLYKWFSNPVIGLVYRMLAITPLKLLIVNEIFAVAWKGDHKPRVDLPPCLTERIVLLLQKYSRK